MILTLTTDFGADGLYVAAMKGVVLGLAPATQIVDVSHAIPPQDVEAGAFVLAEVFDSFPAGTVHLAVVDPGVGTTRRLVVVELAGQWFVLPDNGLIGGVRKGREPSGAWEIQNPKLRREVVSATFHGRDILAPVAAHLLNGGDPAEVGPRVDRLILLEASGPTSTEDGWIGRIVFIDHFGNLITNLRAGQLGPGEWLASVQGRPVGGLIRTYGDRPSGSVVALVGSTGRVEIAVVDGDAAKALGLGRGASVVLRRTGVIDS